MKLSKHAVAAAGLIASLSGLVGCMTQSSAPTAADIKASDSTTALATPSLGNTLNQFNSGQFQYGAGSIDSLKTANSTFEQALTVNPNNSQAKVGAAITGVLLAAAQSPEVKDEINSTIQAGSPLSLNSVSSGNDYSGYSLKKVAIMQRVTAQVTRPEFHQVQDSVATLLLPPLEKAISRLTDVYNDPSFVLTLTIDKKTVVFAHSEAAVLLAGFEALHGFATLALAYDIDVDNNGSYAYLDTIQNDNIDVDHLTATQVAAFNTLTGILKPTSSFLTVRSGWQAKLAGVDGDLNNALTHVKSGLTSIPVGTAAFKNNLLRVCPTSGVNSDCIESSDLSNAMDGVDSARKYMSGPVKVRINDIDSSLTINVSALFNVQDFKKMLPFYNFYDASKWGDTNTRVLYFNASINGAQTANLLTVGNILNSNASVQSKIAQLKTKIYWQDPTFSGFLPGVTSDKLWTLIQQLSLANDGPLAKRSVTHSVMNPYMALDLLGKN